MKAAILKGDSKCPGLIPTSMYDTKLAYYLSMSSEDLKFVVYDKDVYNVDTYTKESLQYLGMCYINNYTHQIGVRGSK